MFTARSKKAGGSGNAEVAVKTKSLITGIRRLLFLKIQQHTGCRVVAVAFVCVTSVEIVSAWADPPGLTISHAWAESRTGVPADTPLYMTINNDTGNADKLLRISCPVATFAEKRIIDKGEGAPAPREIKAIPVKEHQVLTLTADTRHIMLLKTLEKLENGQHFSCSATFSNAGRVEFDVSVQPPGSS